MSPLEGPGQQFQYFLFQLMSIKEVTRNVAHRRKNHKNAERCCQTCSNGFVNDSLEITLIQPMFCHLLLKNHWAIWCTPVRNLIFFIANFLLKTSNLWIWRKRIKAMHDCACLLCRYNNWRNFYFHWFEPTKYNILKWKKIPVPQLHRFMLWTFMMPQLRSSLLPAWLIDEFFYKVF